MNTGSNAADFQLVSTSGGLIGGVQSCLGSPSPQATGSPAQANTSLLSTLLDPGKGTLAIPNYFYVPGSPGSLTIRRTLTNSSSATITTADLRITSLSEANGPPEPGVPTQPPVPAQLRVINPATPTSQFTITGGHAVTVHNLSVDPPATASPGGGLNTTLSIPLPTGGLAPGATISIALSFAVTATAPTGRLQHRRPISTSLRTQPPDPNPPPPDHPAHHTPAPRQTRPQHHRTRHPPMTTTSHEIYGLHLTGVGGPGLMPVPDSDQPRVTIRQARQAPEPAFVGNDRAVLDLPSGRQLVVHRDAGTAIFTGPPLSDDELVHPYLGAAASIFSRWAGREVFHAGAFVCGGLAWAVLGNREAGKSSLLATLADRRWPVLADDLVVTDGHQVFCGRGPSISGTACPAASGLSPGPGTRRGGDCHSRPRPGRFRSADGSTCAGMRRSLCARFRRPSCWARRCLPDLARPALRS